MTANTLMERKGGLDGWIRTCVVEENEHKRKRECVRWAAKLPLAQRGPLCHTGWVLARQIASAGIVQGKQHEAGPVSEGIAILACHLDPCSIYCRGLLHGNRKMKSRVYWETAMDLLNSCSYTPGTIFHIPAPKLLCIHSIFQPMLTVYKPATNSFRHPLLKPEAISLEEDKKAWISCWACPAFTLLMLKRSRALREQHKVQIHKIWIWGICERRERTYFLLCFATHLKWAAYTVYVKKTAPACQIEGLPPSCCAALVLKTNSSVIAELLFWQLKTSITAGPDWHWLIRLNGAAQECKENIPCKVK